jgi:hypothetical protein
MTTSPLVRAPHTEHQKLRERGMSSAGRSSLRFVPLVYHDVCMLRSPLPQSVIRRLTMFHGLQLSGVTPTRFVNSSVKGGLNRSISTGTQDGATSIDVQPYL